MSEIELGVWLDQPDNYLISIQDEGYPALLREIPDPPQQLYVHGDPTVLHTHQLAIVGSRNPSPGGQQTAHEFASALAQAGLTITSGLALGIDAAAHEGALSGGGKTLAVVGTGLDRVYPASNRGLAHQVADGGAIVSEFPLGTPVRPGHFPQRNRIISGLSIGTLVVEAALRSGSLITARLAAEQGREVFALPGSIHNPVARGCHKLIRQGAKLVETAQDILEDLGALAAYVSQVNSVINQRESINSSSSEVLDSSQQQVLAQLGYDPVSVDAVIERGELPAEQVMASLLALELEGYVSSAPGGTYFRLK